MKKDIKFSTRMVSTDREKIRALAAKAHMSMSDYVTACCLGKRIVVIDEQKTTPTAQRHRQQHQPPHRPRQHGQGAGHRLGENCGCTL
ncbi:MAG: hypothetical protein V8S72_03160 [Oscillospiraceae bacterium]